MKASEVYDILLRTAEVTGWTDLVVIGSQAIHGTVEDPSIDAVLRSPDVDLYPRNGYGHNATWENLLLELGFDSEFHINTLHYVESVRVDLARFPDGWLERALTKEIGSIEKNGVQIPVTVTFPEIHDLTVAKLSVKEDRPKDLEFMQAGVRLGLVKRDVLEERYRNAPRTEPVKIEKGLAQIAEAFNAVIEIKETTKPGEMTVALLCHVAEIPYPENTDSPIVTMRHGGGNHSKDILGGGKTYAVDLGPISRKQNNVEKATEILKILATEIDCREAGEALLNCGLVRSSTDGKFSRINIQNKNDIENDGSR